MRMVSTGGSGSRSYPRPISWRSCARICTSQVRIRADGLRRILRRMKNAFARGPGVAAAVLALAACGSTPMRERPLEKVMPITAPVLAPGVEANSDKLFVVVTFSGGGKRAAAFSYGVLEALRYVMVTTPDGEQHTLLD